MSVNIVKNTRLINNNTSVMPALRKWRKKNQKFVVRVRELAERIKAPASLTKEPTLTPQMPVT